MAGAENSLFIKTLKGERSHRPPVWLMRQAGRYLPEYREIRATAKDFLDFCYTPSLSVEATLQPLRRYPFDAAILFADILLVLDAMDRGLRFEAGEGPILNPLDRASDLEAVSLSKVMQRVSPVMETVERLKAALPKGFPLIGFAGSPWTVAVYAIEGRGGTDKKNPKLWAYTRPDDLKAVLDYLVVVTTEYLKTQVDAGADALMLFDSWAENLPDHVFDWLVIEPTRKLVENLRSAGVTVPIIGFPRGAGAKLADYVAQTGVNSVGLDTGQVPSFVNTSLPKGFPVQGHLDPLSVIAGGKQMLDRADQIIEAYRADGRPHVFNLGHGITPDAKPEHVEMLMKHIQAMG
ncbi:uroporphyrinogen decarboxylase [Ponticaulis sp.]|uniref:uroporphyrinogen decarboxylase n=1 Tax=Ponticaulis sp. TaxID=2020902 RepID=UPI000B662ADD|nr:uroporphyrinogen decarboxylase [Ponticaulis sp.]MAJ09426.1 uroporphyrinogen decarboxylase [Ponticaulis sp.]RPG18776.1 MAG: uroporphyrinogen decarboxylase [Hyphomonadaceae bacterium TMED125]HBH90955.1 uroporphyrinogen decarboxylase [Hyphomonadaceae bacterium]